MKKALAILTVGLICFLILTGCGNNADSSGKGSEKVSTITVHGKSMEPTLQDGVSVDVYSLDGTPKTGDIIALKSTDAYKMPMVKRVIAVGGQQLRIDFEKGDVYVDGKKLDEPYSVGETLRGDLSDEEINRVIPEGKVFVLGDNRTISIDSRFSLIGLIDVKDILGVILTD